MQIINAMGGQIEKQQDNNGCLSYWLSNTVTLLYLLQRNIKPASGGAYNARLRSPGSRSASHISTCAFSGSYRCPTCQPSSEVAFPVATQQVCQRSAVGPDSHVPVQSLNSACT